MEIWDAIIMGLVQGLTEFLPVSSSGHLEIASVLFGVDGESNLPFTIAVHLATVLASIVVFRKDIGRIIKGTLKFSINDESAYFVNLIISMLPILMVGLLFREEIEQLFTGNLVLVGSMLVLTGALLTLSHFAKPGSKPITPKRAFIIGLSQAVASVPGISRSGATISTGLMLGLKREEVAKFSFMMVIIPVLGICLLDIIGGDFTGAKIDLGIIAGFITAFFTGLFACKAMIKLVSKGQLIWFALYCAVVGLTSIGFGIFL